jgi:predicted ATP-binding protein involved in virulence
MKEPIYFLNIELDNVRSFANNQVLDLSDGNGNWKKWTVILGDNGLGKTSILQVLSAIAIKVIDKAEDKDFDSSFNSKLLTLLTPPQNLQLNSLGINATLFNETLKLTKSDISKFTANLNRIAANGSNSWGYTSGVGVDNKVYFMNVYSYGANRIIGKSSLAESLSNDNSETLFDDSKKLINAEEWLLQLDYAASKESSIKDFAANKRDQVKQTLIDLLPDVTDIRFTEPEKNDLKSTVEFQTAFGWRSLQELSLGYRTMIAWMVDLAARMFRDNPDSDNPLAEPAIVLVDEIDLHLHPKWQRNIFTYLSDKFPNCQFIVTAHSPLVVQSAPKEANLVVLRKEGNKVIIDNDINSVRNWRLDQIMSSDLFGGSARNEEIENELKERTTLLKKNELTKEEEKRLFKLNEMANNLPTGSNDMDIEAMQIIRKAADFIKSKSN